MSVVSEVIPQVKISPAAVAVTGGVQPQLNPSRHVPALDGLRGLAVICVILVHATVLPYGGIGVDVFFVLSGYLITAILIREKEATGAFSFKNFYIRRWLRLAPAFILLIVLYLLFARVIRQSMWYALGDVGMAMTYASNWTRIYFGRPDYLGHTWSLSIEEQFYLLWPGLALFVWWLVRRRWAAGLVFAAAAVGVMLYRAWLMEAGATTARVYNGLDTRADTLLAGAALAFWMPPVGKMTANVLGWVGMLALAAFVAQNFYMPWMAEHFGPAWYARGSYALPVVSTAAVIIGVMEGRGSWLNGALGWAPLAWVGRLSYGLYLFHFPYVAYLQRNGYRAGEIVAMGLPVTFGLAVLSYYWIELPCLRLKDRFRAGGAHVQAAAS